MFFSVFRRLCPYMQRREERETRLTRNSAVTFRELLSNGRLESDDQRILRNPEFLFGDSIELDDKDLYDVKYKWLRRIGNRWFFLPNIEGMFPLLWL